MGIFCCRVLPSQVPRAWEGPVSCPRDRAKITPAGEGAHCLEHSECRDGASPMTCDRCRLMLHSCLAPWIVRSDTVDEALALVAPLTSSCLLGCTAPRVRDIDPSSVPGSRAVGPWHAAVIRRLGQGDEVTEALRGC